MRLRSCATILWAFLLAPTLASASTISYNDLATFQAAAGSLTLIDFDTVPGGGPAPSFGDIGATYASLGVTFPTGNEFESSFFGPVSSPNGWINNTFDGNDVVFTANFTSSVFAVGVFNVLFGGSLDGSELLAYDAGSNLLGTVVSDADGNTSDFFGLTSSTPIASIQVRVTPGGWGLDDLYFGETTAVPEPTALSFLGLGVLGAIVRHRRKSSSA